MKDPLAKWLALCRTGRMGHYRSMPDGYAPTAQPCVVRAVVEQTLVVTAAVEGRPTTASFRVVSFVGTRPDGTAWRRPVSTSHN